MKQIMLIAIAIICTSAAALPAAAEELEPGETFKDCDNCPKMVVLSTGSSMVKSPPENERRNDREGGAQNITDHRLAVGVYEVTFSEWNYCVRQGRCVGEYRPDDNGWGRPAINVSQTEVYVKWLSEKTKKKYLLLSEAEWKYVERFGTTPPFYFGNTIKKEIALGLLPPNKFDLYLGFRVARLLNEQHLQ